MRIGVAYCNAKRNRQTSPIIDDQFNLLTSTEFYPFHLWNGPGQYHFGAAERAVQEAHDSRRPLHAHCLLYALESVCPQFLVHFQGSNQEFEALVRDYLTVTLQHFRGRISAYDLSNELFAYQGGEVDNNWLRRRFGSDQELFDFIGRCYTYAHAADPAALLFYSDNGQEFRSQNYAKGWAVAHQLGRWKKSGVPIHGYGLHFHTNIYRPQEDIEEALRLAVKTGLKIHLSELDVSLNWCDFDLSDRPGGVQNLQHSSPDLLRRQSETFERIAQAYVRRVPPAQRYGITLWDVGDGDSWLAARRFEQATLFDEHYQPKPAFYGFMKGLAGE
jgi:endo-1,4-beta-xylanase